MQLGIFFGNVFILCGNESMRSGMTIVRASKRPKTLHREMLHTAYVYCKNKD